MERTCFVRQSLVSSPPAINDLHGNLAACHSDTLCAKGAQRLCVLLCGGWHALGNAGQDAVQLEVLEGQLTWLVHIIGAVIRGRLSSSTAESQETIDGDLAARAFGLLQIVDSGYAAEACACHICIPRTVPK